jgi:type IV pilus assembly protein PilC
MNYSTHEQVIFFKRLALYLRSGIPITRALSFISEDAHTRNGQRVLAILEQTVSAGLPFSDGLNKFPKTFDAFTIGFVRTGEQSGKLPDTLEHIALHLKRRKKLKGKIVGALIYPSLIFAGTLIITGFLFFIFSKIIPILKGLHVALPFTTRVLIGLNTLIAQYWLELIGMAFVFIIVISLAGRRSGIRHFVERVLLKVPVLGMLYRDYALATFARTLSLQLSSGVHIVSALSLTQRTLSGSVYPAATLRIERCILTGSPLSTAVREDSKLFPALFIHMITAGEATGNLSENLATLAFDYEDHLNELSKSLTLFIEPVLITAMGGIVGFVALAIITPIYQVTQSL